MAQPPKAPAVQPINVLSDRDHMKVPLFHGDPNLDIFQAEYWIQRLQRLQILYGWTNRNLTSNAINALHGKTLHFCTFLEGYESDVGAF